MNKQLHKQYPYSMLIPGTVIFLLFFVTPTIQGIGYSFTNWDGFSAKWVGLDNFKSFFSDPTLTRIVRNTFIFTIVSTIFKLVLGILLALMVNRELKTKGFLRTVFYSPAVLSNIAVGLIFVAILHPESGILNRSLSTIGLGFISQDWLHNPDIAIYSVAAIEVWKWTGFNMIILLAGLQAIPKDYYEAVSIDGASAWSRFWHITFPLLSPAFNSVFILNLIGGLKVFDMITATTGGGPGTTTEVINTWVYKAYGASRLGESSAGSFVLALLVALVSLITYYFLRRREVEL